MTSPIPFNKPYLHGRELVYIAQAVASGKISGDGMYSKKCHNFFETRYNIKKALLTTSCTDALEMAAILLNIAPGDEVIVPSFTFVSSATAFVLRGAKIIFADSLSDSPNIDPAQVASLITARTKAIVVVHYAGIACHMDEILAIANQAGVSVVEDAAQAVDSFYKGSPLGTIGDLGTFSFHETKNVIAGEGGLLAVNNAAYLDRAEVIREKGTNRSAFFRGEVNKYGWVDIGSSFLPSEIVAAYLYAQLEILDDIQDKRVELWQRYYSNLANVAACGKVSLPVIPDFATNNAHMFYLLCNDVAERTALISALKGKGIHAVFHYISLHSSEYYSDKHDGRILPNSDRYTNTLVRLPLYYELSLDQVDMICEVIESFYK